MKRHEIKGMQFGRLTAKEAIRTKRVRPNGRVENDIKWLCVCECGMTTMAHATDLIKGKVRSCGCLHIESTSERFKKHGGRGERLYTIWGAMKQRCYYNKAQHRANYSMKGIKVCDEWKDDYSAFRKWAYANGYYEQDKSTTPHKEMLSIDRIDPDGDYCPENCQWISCDANLRKQHTDKLIRGEGR